MAGDWIKMRADLSTSPKVVRIASALRADRFRVIGGLHAVWSLFDAHSANGVLDGYTLETLDEMIGFPGIAAAMESVGWLSSDGDSLSVPRFDEHNGKSAKRRATETERKRNARNTSSEVSASDADKMRSREEKRREEEKIKEKEKTKAAPPSALPAWVPGDAWAGFVAMRVKVRKPMTERARELLLSKLDAMRGGGHDIAAVLDQSTVNGWQDVFPLKTVSDRAAAARTPKPENFASINYGTGGAL